MIKIAIDGNEANVTHPVGSNVYALELLKALEELTRTNKNVSWTVLLAGQPGELLPTARANWQYQTLTPTKLWTQLALPLHLFKHRRDYDVFFTPGHYGPRISAIPYVSSVMDVAYLQFPDQFRKSDLLQLKNWTDYSVKNATKVVTISQASKQDILKHYHKTQDDVVVAYPALPSVLNQETIPSKRQLQSKFQIGGEFLAYVGTLQPRKNLINLIEAFEILTRSLESSKVSSNKRSGLGGRKKRVPKYKNLHLVIAGKIGWLADPILQRVEASPFSDRIILTDYVTEAEKIGLLKHAQASVLVGLYEGFGIPPLESMAQGTVPVVANTTSLPEVVDDAGILVDPYDPKAIARGLERAVTMSATQKAKLRRQMRQQLKKFSWQKSAQIILETLTTIANEN